MVKINEYIESGVLETYVLGAASKAETEELLYMKAKYPEIRQALEHLEIDLERIAQHMAITPPPTAWGKIESGINELVRMREGEILTIEEPVRRSGNQSRSRRSGQFIEVEAESGHMRIRKVWRWVFGAVFLLGKIFLAFAIYFYLQNRQQADQIKELKTELKSHSNR